MDKREQDFEDWKRDHMIAFHFPEQEEDCWIGFVGGYESMRKESQISQLRYTELLAVAESLAFELDFIFALCGGIKGVKATSKAEEALEAFRKLKEGEA